MKTTSQKKSNRLPQESEQSQLPARVLKHDAEIITARQHPAWVEFEADIYTNDFLRARVSRCLDRYGLGSSSAMVDEALDFLVRRCLGASALFFNQSGKAGFNRLQVVHAVSQFMSRKEQQRHMTDLALNEDDADHSEDLPGSVRASHLANHDQTTPDEQAARSDAARTIADMVADKCPELYDILLSLGESGTRDRINDYASRNHIAPRSTYDRLDKLAETIQSHPLFAEFAKPLRPQYFAA